MMIVSMRVIMMMVVFIVMVRMLFMMMFLFVVPCLAARLLQLLLEHPLDRGVFLVRFNLFDLRYALYHPHTKPM